MEENIERFIQAQDRGRSYDEALQEHSGKSAGEILGGIDALKVRSCMTLFDVVSPNDVFNDVLTAFYEGKRCKRTLEMIGKLH